MTCTNIRDLFPSQARAAAAIGRHGRSSMTKINESRVAALMAAHQDGKTLREDNPFDMDDAEDEFADLLLSLVRATEADPSEALWMGLWIGFEYAHREITPGEES